MNRIGRDGYFWDASDPCAETLHESPAAIVAIAAPRNRFLTLSRIGADNSTRPRLGLNFPSRFRDFCPLLFHAPAAHAPPGHPTRRDQLSAMLNPAASARRAIPSLDRLLKLGAVESLLERYGRPLVTEIARDELARLRTALARSPADFDEAGFVRACAARLARELEPSLKPVFNLTGTVLHTNLGRAVMPEEAAQAVARAMTRPVNLEFDLEGGDRGERDKHIERLLVRSE